MVPYVAPLIQDYAALTALVMSQNRRLGEALEHAQSEEPTDEMLHQLNVLAHDPLAKEARIKESLGIVLNRLPVINFSVDGEERSLSAAKLSDCSGLVTRITGLWRDTKPQEILPVDKEVFALFESYLQEGEIKDERSALEHLEGLMNFAYECQNIPLIADLTSVTCRAVRGLIDDFELEQESLLIIKSLGEKFHNQALEFVIKQHAPDIGLKPSVPLIDPDAPDAGLESLAPSKDPKHTLLLKKVSISDRGFLVDLKKVNEAIYKELMVYKSGIFNLPCILSIDEWFPGLGNTIKEYCPDELKVNGSKMNENGIESLLQNLIDGDRKKLKSLIIYVPLTEKHCQQLAILLEKNPQLNSFTLTTKLDEKSISTLSPALSKHQGLEKITLLRQGGLFSKLNLSQLTNLNNVSLYRFPFEVSEEFINFLKDSKKLESLALCACSIEKEDLVEILFALNEAKTLRTLSFEQINFDNSEGKNALLDYLKHNKIIDDLELIDCRMDSNFLVSLLEVLSTTHVKKLTLNDNVFNNLAVRQLVLFLEGNSDILNVNLKNCDLKSDDVSMIADALPHQLNSIAIGSYDDIDINVVYRSRNAKKFV